MTHITPSSSSSSGQDLSQMHLIALLHGTDVPVIALCLGRTDGFKLENDDDAHVQRTARKAESFGPY